MMQIWQIVWGPSGGCAMLLPTECPETNFQPGGKNRLVYFPAPRYIWKVVLSCCSISSSRPYATTITATGTWETAPLIDNPNR